MRAQTPRRLGTTAISRPPAASTRQTSRNSSTGSADISSACTSSTRSTAESVSGSSSSSTSAASAGRARRPAHHALRRRHQGEAALGLLAEQAEIGRRIADAQDPQCAGVLPARANAAADEAPRHDAEALGVEIAQVDDIHEGKIARIGLRVSAAMRSRLTPRLASAFAKADDPVAEAARSQEKPHARADLSVPLPEG